MQHDTLLIPCFSAQCSVMCSQVITYHIMQWHMTSHSQNNTIHYHRAISCGITWYHIRSHTLTRSMKYFPNRNGTEPKLVDRGRLQQNIVECNRMQYTEVEQNRIQRYMVLQCTALLSWIVLYCIVLHPIVLHCWYCVVWHGIVLYCIELQL